jgi:hypothetical protein
MEIKNTNTELIPKSIFKGTNADGNSLLMNGHQIVLVIHPI